MPLLGLPGVAVRVSAGARLRVFFDGSDRARPRAALSEEDDSTLVSISVAGGTANVARSGDETTTGWYTFTSAAAGSPVAILAVPAGTPNAVQLVGTITGTGAAKFKA